MAAFCAKCGAPLAEGAVFCGTCGAQVVQAVAPPPPAPSPWAQPTPPPAAAPSPWAQQAPPAAAPSPWGQQPPPPPAAPSPWGEQPAGAAPAKSGGGTKVVLIVLGVLFVIAVLVVGGIVWEVHRAMNKAKAIASEAGFSSSDIQSIGDSTHLDACKYLSASDVSDAIGVTIIEAKSDSTGCHYIAKGSAASFTMRHLAAEGGAPAMSPEAGGESDTSDTETTSLVDISIQSGGGKAQLKLQKALMGGLGINGSAHPDVSGIGDEAFAISNNLLIARKGDEFIQITYTSCPCALGQIGPLAKKLINQL